MIGLREASRLPRQAIIKKAFEGKLVPQDPDDEPVSVLLDRIRSARVKYTATGDFSLRSSVDFPPMPNLEYLELVRAASRNMTL